MAHNARLWQAILDDPHDDGVRLVYADWLEEYGDALRAEFIRLQCRLAATPSWDDDFVPLRERMLLIRQTAGATWLQDYPGLKDRSPRFVRGFVGEVTCSDRWWVRQSRGLARRAPIEQVWLEEAQVADLEALLAAPATRRLSELALRVEGDPLKRAHVELLAQTPMPALRGLDLSGNRLTPLLLDPLAAADGWPALSRLSVRRNHLMSGGLGALVKGRLPWRLTWLNAADCHLDRPDIDALFASPLLETLTALDLSSNRLAPPGQQARWRQVALGSLRCLRLDQALYKEMAAELAECPAAAGLRALSLELARIDPAAFKRCAWAEPMQTLQELALCRNAIGDGGVAFLAHANVLPRLNVLDLRENGLTADGVARLLLWPGLGHLRELRLGSNPVGDEGITVLARGPALPHLLVLDLARTGATDAGVRALAESPQLPELTTLLLGDNPAVGDAGVRALLESKALAHLCRVSLDDFRLGPALRQAFHQHFVGATSR